MLGIYRGLRSGSLAAYLRSIIAGWAAGMTVAFAHRLQSALTWERLCRLAGGLENGGSARARLLED